MGIRGGDDFGLITVHVLILSPPATFGTQVCHADLYTAVPCGIPGLATWLLPIRPTTFLLVNHFNLISYILDDHLINHKYTYIYIHNHHHTSYGVCVMINVALEVRQLVVRMIPFIVEWIWELGFIYGIRIVVVHWRIPYCVVGVDFQASEIKPLFNFWRVYI